jgi:hypothetical protein
MTIDYLDGVSWADWSREERMFCAVLYEHARKDPAGFASWVIDTAPIELAPAGDWDLGYEVCFYRDYLKRKDRSARGEDYPFKRTFDLCLFGEQAIVVIEAKVCEGFSTHQNIDFEADKTLIRRALGRDDIAVVVVPLAGSDYLANAKSSTLGVFTGSLSWRQVLAKYPDPILERAEGMYSR